MNNNLLRRLLRLEAARALAKARAPEQDSLADIRQWALEQGMSGEQFGQLAAEVEAMTNEELLAVVRNAPSVAAMSDEELRAVVRSAINPD